MASQSYSNELTLFGGALNIKLDATFEPKDDASAPATALRVAFRSITFSLLGVRLPSVDFPAGTERTWLLTFADDDTRLVRAGVDGGKSTARDIGLIEKGAGEAADSYLFVLTRASEAEYSGDADGAWPRGVQPLSASLRRRELKAKLLDECRDANLGAGADASSVASIGGLIEQLAELNPTTNPVVAAAVQHMGHSVDYGVGAARAYRQRLLRPAVHRRLPDHPARGPHGRRARRRVHALE